MSVFTHRVIRYEGYRALGPTTRGKIIRAFDEANANQIFVTSYMVRRVEAFK